MCLFLFPNKQEDQIQKVRASNSIKFQQLETTIQGKLGDAQSRREQLEQEQKEKLRNHVSLPTTTSNFVALP